MIGTGVIVEMIAEMTGIATGITIIR